MVSRRTLLALVAAALAAVVAAALVGRERVETPPPALYPGLAGRVQDIAEVRLSSSRGEVTLVRTGQQWGVRERGGYAASSARLRELLQGLVGLSAPEAKTRDPKLYERVGLDPERGEKPSRLELRDGVGQTVVNLWIGRSRALVTDVQRNEYFVRRGDEAQVWRVEGRLPLDAAPESWIEKQILTLARERIRAVSVAPQEGPAYRVSREGADKPEFVLEGLGAGEQLESPLRVNSLISAVQNLSAEDVRGPDSGVPLQERGRVAIETFDGLKVELQLLAGEGKRYTRLSTAGIGADAVNQEAARLNERWRGWTYQLADYQADSLFAKRAELVKAAGGSSKSAVPGKPPAASDKPRR